MKDTTLCILVRENPTLEVLLGFKKVRFGACKYTGFRGRVEPGERFAAAADPGRQAHPGEVQIQTG